MERNDFERFRDVMTGMAKVYERELDGLVLDAYWMALRDWTLAEFERAAAHLIAHSEFMPRPAAFNAMRQSMAQPTVGEAWARVLEHIKGPYRSGMGIDDGGPIDTAVAGLDGYRELALCEVQFLPRLRFAERYEEALDMATLRPAIGTRNGEMRSVSDLTAQLTFPPKEHQQ